MTDRAVDYPAERESLFTLARGINDFMPRHTWHLTRDGLFRAGVPPAGACIAVLGWAFLANSDDARNTPSAPFREQALAAGATVAVQDPHVEAYPGVTIERDLDKVLTGADAVVILTGHRIYRSLDPRRVKDLSGKPHPVIVDGRNIVDPEDFIRAGFVYKGIGRGDHNQHPLQEGP
jgi:UDP-N-acetyl-D-mannosaminuronate dehydrogenase